jgi:uncharacterized protein YecT (DUF1311 family)
MFESQLLIACGILLAGAAAQTGVSAAPADSPDSRPAAAVFHNSIPADQLSFLNEYAGRPAKELIKDKRFRNLMKQVVPRTEYHYGRDMPLTEATESVVFGSRMPVEVREGRYVTVSGREGPYLEGRGFLWFDMTDGIGLGGVYFHPVNGEPTPTLAIFSSQLKQDSLGMSQLPLAFAEDVGQWEEQMRVPATSPRYFIPEDGKKYVLVHDEDYCDHPDNAPPPPQAECQQRNADAADADLNAAAFMRQSHNAANATAWGLRPELVTWISYRDNRCRLGPDRMGCRIRMTRQRTQALLGQR